MFKVAARERDTYCLEYCCCTLDILPLPVGNFVSRLSRRVPSALKTQYDFSSTMKSHYCIVVSRIHESRDHIGDTSMRFRLTRFSFSEKDH